MNWPTAKERAARRRAKAQRSALIQPTQPHTPTTAPTLNDQILAWINDHYISLRKKRVDQFVDKADGQVRYVTYGGHKGSTQNHLVDYVVRRHLKQECTIGIFAAAGGSRFICFDVDYESNMKKATEVTQSLVGILKGEFGLRDDEYLVTFSGSKGFHVEVFFKGLVPNRLLTAFYQLMLRMLEVKSTEVELRPTPSQAVKLPLSINLKTGKKCSIVHPELMHNLPDEHILTIKSIDFAVIEETMNDLMELYPEERPLREKGDHHNGDSFSSLVEADYIKRVLTAGTLIEGGTRHKVTLGIATLFNTESRKKVDAIELIMAILEATMNKHRQLLGKHWTLESLRKETERVVLQVYKSDLKLGVKSRDVYLTKEDVLFCSRPKKQKERELLLAMLIHSRKYANAEGIFYVTNGQLSKYGVTLNRSRIKEYWTALQGSGLIEVLAQNVYSGRRIIVDNKELSVKDPNVYRITKEAPEEGTGVKIEDFHVKKFDEIVASFMSEQEVRELYGRQVYNRRFKHFYNQ